MTSLLFLILVSLIVGLAVFIFFIVAGRSKQFEDIEGPKYRMMDDDDED
ncbi:MAG: cbb3-type cytochrome oxidase assembly protein CcoS [Deferribacterales bacterium]|nr:cbb3-type cytochrome oxidase assembly protein CcoS [Deferribacterales bacterium]